MKSRRTIALSITPEVKRRVWVRDEGRCVWCGSKYANPEAHYIPRSKSGLGIEENILTLCRECHHSFDFGGAEIRNGMRAYFERYLRSIYPDWSEDKLVYRK